MWKPADLRLDYIQMKSGGLDKVPLPELRGLIMYHDNEVAKVREKMSVELFQECDKILYHLQAFYDIQKEQAKLEKKAFKKSQKKNDGEEKLTPTELYKAHFGESPSQAFRRQFDSFNKTEYARWLREQTRGIRHSGKN